MSRASKFKWDELYFQLFSPDDPNERAAAPTKLVEWVGDTLESLARGGIENIEEGEGYDREEWSPDVKAAARDYERCIKAAEKLKAMAPKFEDLDFFIGARDE
jgi:hypothetical protein